MAEPELTDYIKKTRAAGFPENKIRQALVAAGWTDEEIKVGFVAIAPRKEPQAEPKKQKLFLIILIILVLLPLVILGGYWAYRKLTYQTDEQVAGQETLAPDEIKQQRDSERLKHIENLQIALDQYLRKFSVYPQTLLSLKTSSLLNKIPLDPKTGEPYLYIVLGDEALHYSLSFILETKIDDYQPGLVTVSSEKSLGAGVDRNN